MTSATRLRKEANALLSHVILHAHVFVYTEYAQVIRMLGNGRLEAQCVDGIKRLCHIRGKMRKKVWVNTVRNDNVQLSGRLHLFYGLRLHVLVQY